MLSETVVGASLRCSLVLVKIDHCPMGLYTPTDCLTHVTDSSEGNRDARVIPGVTQSIYFEDTYDPLIEGRFENRLYFEHFNPQCMYL